MTAVTSSASSPSETSADLLPEPPADVRAVRRGALWLSGGRLGVVVVTLGVLTGGALAAGLDRAALWAVVRYCAAQKEAIGLSFPCLDVDLQQGRERGVAVLRAPLERSHIIVVPTTRIKGVESPMLLAPGVTNYWERAWEARHYVTDEIPRALDRADLGMAVNSAGGRSQDQLHIHVDCVDSDVRRALDEHQAEIGPSWRPLPFRVSHRAYWAMRLDSEDLAGVNPVKIVAATLPGASSDMRDETVVVLGASFRDGRSGFYLLASQSGYHGGAVGEDLLDHTCPRR